MNSIYIHIPFCNKKCSYCDFYVLTNMPKAYTKYVEYLKKEIAMYPKHNYDTIYFGGGTPSVLSIEQIRDILKDLDHTNEAEITLELNPTNMSKEKLIELRNLGVNRLSIGMQSFDDNILKLMNREHNSSDSIKTYYDAREAGFDNISIDLIFAVPGQSLEHVKKDLDMIERLNPNHISIYSLIWEEGSKFSKLLKENKIKALDEELEANMFELIIQRLNELGYEHYEVSSFCKDKKYGRHNLKYWKNKEFIGVGISASSYYDGKRFEKIRNLRKYYDSIDKGIIPINQETIEIVDEKELRNLEYILGLRMLNVGIECHLEKKEKIDKLISQNMLRKEENRIYLTHKGLMLSDNVILELMDI